MTAVRPVHIIRPLKPVFDVEIRIAAAPAAEFRRARHSAGVNERDPRKARNWRRQRRKIVFRREGAPGSRISEGTAVVPDVAEPEFIDERRSEDVNARKYALLAIIDRVGTTSYESRETSDAWRGSVRNRKPGENRVLRRNALINSNISLIGIRAARRSIEEIPGERSGRAEVWKRNEILDSR